MAARASVFLVILQLLTIHCGVVTGLDEFAREGDLLPDGAKAIPCGSATCAPTEACCVGLNATAGVCIAGAATCEAELTIYCDTDGDCPSTGPKSAPTCCVAVSENATDGGSGPMVARCVPSDECIGPLRSLTCELNGTAKCSEGLSCHALKFGVATCQ